MYAQKSEIESRFAALSAEDSAFLREIYAPTEVAAPPEDAFCSLCVTADGELRSYGRRPQSASPDGPAEAVYLASRDCGLSWKLHRADPDAMGASVKSPFSERWLSPFRDGQRVWMRISDAGGCGCIDYRVVPVGTGCVPYRLPLALRSVRRWLLAADYCGHSAVFLSDDDGESWRMRELPPADRFVTAPPHQGPRWENSGVEPAVLELNDGRLMAMLRTSTDYHYVSYSDDHGESWSRPAPTAFHSTLTNPHLLRLADGRILFFFNNTRPLPEQAKDDVWPPLSEDEKRGVWEDVFTNRDANCVAVSEDDGKSWFGFRELNLNSLRNTCDFRSSGSNASGRDKSVHQFQALELPMHKVLVQVGQHANVRRLILFDVDWLYETDRAEDFRCGLGALSTQVYLRSVSGGFRGFTGHCAWNRTNGAVPVPDPSGDHTEALLLKNTDDDRLLSNAQGAVWNFPAAFCGEVHVALSVRGAGLRLSLLDHWMNPIDLTVERYAQFTCVLHASDTAGDGYTDVCLRFDTAAGEAVVRAGGAEYRLPMQGNAPNGLCYLHLQTVSDRGDAAGTLVKRMQFIRI